MPATTTNAIPSYFVVMIDLGGRYGREAIVDPEITRNGVISRIKSGEYSDVLFIQYVQPGQVPQDVTDDLIGEAEAMREAA